MTDRIIDFSDAPARLRARYDQLIVTRPDEADVSIPLADLAVVIVSHPQVTYTQAVLCGLAERGASLVACNRRHLPVGMVMPLVGHHAQAERFAAQARAPLPVRKRLWQQVVRAKIEAQAAVLEDLHGTDHGLRALVPLVRSGDPANVEARASRRYWPRLFTDLSFRRDPDREDQNVLLNYGYAVLRAIVARAICGAGLHPCLGIHHHNRYDTFCLADDLMEPFRPLVDGAVAALVSERGHDAPLDRAAKTALLEGLTRRLELQGESRTLFDVLTRTAASLADVVMGRGTRLVLPEG